LQRGHGAVAGCRVIQKDQMPGLLATEVVSGAAHLLFRVGHPLDNFSSFKACHRGADLRLRAEITRYEPRSALFSGSDGLDAIRRLVPALGEVSLAALEIGSGQAAPVTAMLSAAGFRTVEVLRDLAGLDRVLVALQ